MGIRHGGTSGNEISWKNPRRYLDKLARYLSRIGNAATKKNSEIAFEIYFPLAVILTNPDVVVFPPLSN